MGMILILESKFDQKNQNSSNHNSKVIRF